jgi:hypothetical protein
MVKSFAKVPLKQRTSDFAYWQSQPYDVRLATLEQIRRMDLAAKAPYSVAR